MSTNKNAAIRYMYLDQLLSDRNHEYTCRDLVEKVNDRMSFAGFGSIWSGDPDDISSAKRLIQLDLEALQDEPFNMVIDHSRKIGTAPVYRYADPTQTLFSKQLTDDEKLMLREILNTLGQFSGLDNFEWMDDLRERLRDKHAFGNANPMAPKPIEDFDGHKIIEFEENKDLHNKEYLTKIFSCIARKQTISVNYRKFNYSEINHYVVFPYMLKQYLSRWYLICTPDGTKEHKFNPDLVMSLPLDRFEDEVSVCEDIPFKECAVDLEDRFYEIIGVTYYENEPYEPIVLAIKNEAFPYIDTKPLHGTQTRCKDPMYQLEGFTTITIKCRYNHELLSKIYSFGDELIVLKPDSLRNRIIERLERQKKLYQIK